MAQTNLIAIRTQHMWARMNLGARFLARSLSIGVLSSFLTCFSLAEAAGAFHVPHRGAGLATNHSLLQLAQSNDEGCAAGQVMIGGKCRTLGKKPAAQFEETTDTGDNQAGDTCAAGQVMIGGKCRTLGKPVTEQPPVAEGDSGGSSESGGDVCATGQVMIGGKCRTLGKKPAASPAETSAPSNDQAGDSCAAGQVMIGGKCRTLGKPVTEQPPVTEGDSGGSSESAGDVCVAGQVMVGGKCRTLGKKPVPPPEETSEPSNEQAGDSCAAGQVMIGGKCRTLGKKPVAPPADASEPSNEQAGDSCAAGQVMIGGKCRTLGKKPAAQPEETTQPVNEQAGETCASGQVLIGGKCRTLGKKPVAQPEDATEPEDSQTDDACDAGQVMIGGRCRTMAGKKPSTPEPSNEDVTSDDGDSDSAEASNTERDFPAGSWGGVVRAGPGRDFPKVTSLKEGARITVIRQASEPDNGYPWFEIEFGGSQTGFQWGGIMCSLDEPREGLFQTCGGGVSGDESQGAASGSAQGINGQNVGLVRHPGGSFSATGGGRWVEYDANGNPSFQFTETGRDEWSVYLKDASRNVDLQLDLFQKKIFYSDANTSRAPLYEITDVSAISGQQDEQADGSGDGLVWQSKWFNDAALDDALTSQLIYGIPETDAVKFFANCGGRSKDALILVVWADVSARKKGSPVKIRFSNDRINTTYRGTVQKSASGEGLEGYRISMGADDPLWEAMSAGSEISYGEPGQDDIALPLKGSREAITNFLSGCRLIDQSQGD